MNDGTFPFLEHVLVRRLCGSEYAVLGFNRLKADVDSASVWIAPKISYSAFRPRSTCTMHRPRHYLVTIDAFGTIFSPRASIGAQYVEITRKYLQSVNVPNAQLAPLLTDRAGKDVDTTFRKVYKDQCARFPNYGKDARMTPEQWWSQVIERSINPVLRMVGQNASNSSPSIARRLIQHFASSGAYEFHEDARDLIRALKTQKQRSDAEFIPIIGVVSNFDPRVRNILRSFGLVVSDVHLGARELPRPSAEDEIDFVLISYDLGIQKPNPAVFDAATDLTMRLLPQEARSEPFLKIHVGDSLENDAMAALQAGWHALLIDRNNKSDHHESPKQGLEYIHDLPPPAIQTLSSLRPWNPCILRTLSTRNG